MSARVYRYGLLAPTEGAALVREQMRAAHRYQNDLIAIERGRREAFRAVMSSDTRIAEAERAVADADARVLELLEAAKRARVESRSKADAADVRAAIAEARAARAAAVRALRELRPIVREELRPRIAEVDDRAHGLQLSARAHCGVYWGTYLLSEAAAEQARKSPMDPRFQRWDGSGQVSVQLQGGATIAEVTSGTDTRLRWPAYVEGTRKAKRTELTMRVGSDEKGRPVWSRWPMVYHRPLPDGAIVKRVIVTLRMRGPREEWSCEVTLDTAACTLRPTAPETSVAVHVGWRSDDGGIRVATWRGSDGASGTIVCPDRVRSGLAKSESLRSIRDRNLDELRARMVSDRETWPEWLREQTTSLHQWRSPARFAALARRWKAHGVEAEHTESYGALEAWRYNDVHLWRWEHDQRLSSERYRREVYRIAAAQLAARYRRLILSDTNWAELAAVPEAGDGAPALRDEARAQRVVAAPSRLVEALVSAMGETVYVSATDITRTCRSCGAIEDGEGFERACSACGVVRDVDEAAAATMLDRERSGAWAYARTARKGEEASKIKEVRAKKWAGKCIKNGEPVAAE